MPHLSTQPRAVRRGAPLACLALVACLTSCSTESQLPPLEGGDATACARVVAALPDALMGSRRTESTDRSVTYEDVEVTCGVSTPEDYRPTAECHEVGGVGWYVPAKSLNDLDEDLLAVALSHEPYVQLTAPARQRLQGTDAALRDLAVVITAELGEGLPCL